jgi:hypothetical protein
MSGCSASNRRNSNAVIAITVSEDVATTVAVRWECSAMAISPNQSPGTGRRGRCVGQSPETARSTPGLASSS